MSDNTKKPKPEKYLTAKEIAYEFEDLGIRLSVDYVRAIIHELTSRKKAIRNKYARFSDCWDFWTLNPDYMPFSDKPQKRIGKTLGFLEKSTA
jgi:hypothetical protein